MMTYIDATHLSHTKKKKRDLHERSRTIIGNTKPRGSAAALKTTVNERKSMFYYLKII